MKKILFVLLCAANAVLVGCKPNTNDSKDQTPTYQPTVDTTTYAVEVRTYAGEDFLKYVTAEYLFKKSTSETYETLQNVKEVPTDKTKDETVMLYMADSELIQEQLHVYSTTLRLPVGDYDFRVKYTRNTVQVTTDSVYNISGFNALSATSSVTLTQIGMENGKIEQSQLDTFINLLQSHNNPHYAFVVNKKY